MYSKFKPSYLHEQITNYLLDKITRGEFPDNRLPGEETLAKNFGVSRPTVRAALDYLNNIDVITKRFGKSTYCHPNIARMKCRIDVNTDFRDLLGADGQLVTVERKNVRWISGEKELGERLQLEEQEKIVAFDVYYFQDKSPAILCKFYIPEKFFCEENIEEMFESTDFVVPNVIQRFGKGELVKIGTQILVDADKPASQFFGLPDDTMLMHWRECWYNIEDLPSACSDVYFAPGCMTPSFVVNI